MSKSGGKLISLHNHSFMGSPLDGLNSMEDLFIGSQEAGHAGVALTDHGSMAGIYDAWEMSKKTGVKLIPGCEFYFTDDFTKKKSYHLVLLAQNKEGYKNILRLNYEANKNQSSGYMGKRTPRIGWEHLKLYNKGVFALTACSSGIISKTLISDRDEVKALSIISKFQSIFKDRFFLEIQPHNLVHVNKDGKEVNQVKLNEALVKYSKDLNIPFVITCDAHYRNKEMAQVHDFMLSIKSKKSFSDPDRFRYGVQDMYLKPSHEITDFFGKEVSEIGMQNSMKIFDACDNPSYLEPLGPTLPRFPVKDQDDYLDFRAWFEKNSVGMPEDKAYLRYKCIVSFKNKFSGLPKDELKARWERIQTEINVLELRNFSSYMLIVSDYTTWGKNNGVSAGPGRGSVVGSLVAFLLGITSVDPIEYGLFFERFHNTSKKSYPDIDLDFSKRNKNMIKEYLKSKYGREKVAYISNWSTLSPKVTIKDVARSLELGGSKKTAFQISNSITSSMSDSKTIENNIDESKAFAGYMKKYPDLYKYSSKLQGITRNWSTHAAGVIIGIEPIYNNAPVRIDKEGNMVVQWEKNRTENFGYIKMDILGLKTLDVIDDALDMVNLSRKDKITRDNMPLQDKETFDMIGRGETAGVFQLESSLTPLCVKIKPKSIKEIADINALGRPSCSPAERNAFIRRKYNLDAVTYRHPNLKRALESTLGISLYEEGMMIIAKDCAGWDLNQADALRKITKLKGKDPELVKRTESSFVEDCMKHSGMTYRKAKEIWKEEIEPFGLYGFNLAHAVAYSHISYYTAWIKCHYPTEFMCALLNGEDSNSDKSMEYINVCSVMGLSITPPDVNTSRGNYVITGDREIATGLTAMKGVGERAISELMSLQPFVSLEDFFFRTNGRVINKRVIQAMAKAGAFRSLNRTRKDIFDNYSEYRTKVSKEKKKEKTIDDIKLPRYDIEWERKEFLIAEREVLGRTISGSLHEVFAGFFTNRPNITPLNSLNNLHEGDNIKIEVIINMKVKELKIKRGRNIGKKFAKYLVEDASGATTEMTVWQKDYERYNLVLKDGLPIKAICKVDEYMGQKGLSLSVLERVLGREI